MYIARFSVDVMNISSDSEDLFVFLQLDSNPKARKELKSKILIIKSQPRANNIAFISILNNTVI